MKENRAMEKGCVKRKDTAIEEDCEIGGLLDNTVMGLCERGPCDRRVQSDRGGL